MTVQVRTLSSQTLTSCISSTNVGTLMIVTNKSSKLQDINVLFCCRRSPLLPHSSHILRRMIRGRLCASRDYMTKMDPPQFYPDCISDQSSRLEHTRGRRIICSAPVLFLLVRRWPGSSHMNLHFIWLPLTKRFIWMNSVRA